MEEVGKILPLVFRRHVQRTGPRVIETLAPFWPRVVGKAIAHSSRPVAFSAGTLSLVCDCSSWSRQLRQMAEEIRAEINKFLGGPVVKQVRVRCVASLGPAPWPEPQPASVPVIPADQKAWADSSMIPDSDLARVVESSYRKYFARCGRKVH